MNTTSEIIDANGVLIGQSVPDCVVAKAIESSYARAKEIVANVSAIEVSDTTMGTKDAAKETAEKLKNAGSAEGIRAKVFEITRAAVNECNLTALLMQLDERPLTGSTKANPISIYSIVKRAVDEKKAEIDAWKESHTPPAPTHTYCIQLQCTDKGLKGILTALEKYSANNYRYCAPQSDKGFKALDKWFAENA